MFGIEPRAAKIAWTVFLVAAALFALYTIRSALLVVTYAIFFAYLVYPLVKLAERITPASVPRTAAIALVFLFVVLVVAVSGALFGSRIVDEAIHFSQNLPALFNIENISQHVPLPHFLEPQRARIVAFVTAQAQSGIEHAVPLASRMGVELVHTAGNLIYLVLIPILSFLLIKEAPDLRRDFLLLVKRSESRVWRAISNDLDTLLASYVRSLLLLSIATFVSYSIALSLFGAPYALLLGITSALLEFIPFVGPLAAAGIILTVVGFSGFAHLLWIALFILAYRIFQDYVLGPYLMSEGVEVSPLFVIVGLLAGEEVGGIAGVFLSVPVIAASKIVFVRLRALYAIQSEAVQAAAESQAGAPPETGQR